MRLVIALIVTAVMNLTACQSWSTQLNNYPTQATVAGIEAGTTQEEVRRLL